LEPETPWPIEGHAGVLEGLWRAAREEHLHHALLFAGLPGIGRFRAARALAQGLFCERAEIGPPCNDCGPCKRLLSGNHPDLFVIDPLAEEEEQIKLERIAAREEGRSDNVESFLGLRPVEGGWRVAIVREAERANASAQNAMLKMLEEPGRSVLWILESSRTESLLPTLRSRCAVVRFEPLSEAETLRVLARSGLEGAAAERLARWSGGSAGVALASSERGVESMRAALVSVLCGHTPALEAARGLWQIEASFPGRTPTARARERARTLLDLALAMLRDVARLGAGVDPSRLAHGDLSAHASELEGVNQPGILRWQAEQLIACRRDVDLNLQPEAALERAMLALARRASKAHSRSGRAPEPAPQ
jgi:DNA polymerase-3 subunit delta'